MNITKVLLAAGKSTRFGQCKLTQFLNETTVIEHSVDTLRALSEDCTYVITGAWHDEVSEILRDVDSVEVLYNQTWSNGLGDSIAFATDKLGQIDRGLLFMLADQVALTTADLKRLTLAFASKPIRCCSSYNHQLGVPAIFPPGDNYLLSKLTGEYGAKKLLLSGDSILRISVPSAAIDIDTPSDLVRVRDILSNRNQQNITNPF